MSQFTQLHAYKYFFAAHTSTFCCAYQAVTIVAFLASLVKCCFSLMRSKKNQFAIAVRVMPRCFANNSFSIPLMYGLLLNLLLISDN